MPIYIWPKVSNTSESRIGKILSPKKKPMANQCAIDL